MLNEERIKLMTRMASYEDSEGKPAIHVCSYFRSDYISLNVVKAVVAATFSYLLVLAMYIYYNADSLLENIYSMNLQAVCKKLLTGYVITAGIYALISYVLYSFRYDRARRSLKDYSSALKILSEMYNKQNQGANDG